MQVLNFTVDSALLRELGEKLVETVHLALVELVKNCYDADATSVEVLFTKDSKGNTQIKIIDNGIGMNYKAVENYWMRIATTNKKDRDVSAVFGRPLTGAKGIGRFSCRRLGSHLKLVTVGTKEGNNVGVQSSVQKTEVDFPWKNFEPGVDVTRIECEGHQSQLRNSATGTTLIISGISEEWSTQGINWLKRQLAVLAANRGVKRKGFSEDPGFNVKLTTPDFKGGVTDLREELINSGWGTLTAYIDEKHQAICKLEALGFKEPRTITSSIKFSHLKDISIKLGIFVDDKTQMRDTSVLSKGNLSQILPEWGGVQVRYKGFRVYPYGDDDWLDIDHDRGLRKGAPKDELFSFAQSLKGVDPGRSLLNQLSMRSYVGNVQIGKNAVGFEMKLNREGFVSSAQVTQLKEFVRYVVDWSTIVRDFSLRKQAQLDSTEAKSNFEEVIGKSVESSRVIDAAVDYLRSEVKTISRALPYAQRREVEQSLYKATEAIKKHNDSNQTELSHLRLIASTSTLLLIFSHEVKSLLGMLEQSKNSLNLLAETLSAKQKQTVIGISSNFTEFKDRLEELLGLTALVGTDHRKAKPGQVALLERIIKVEKAFELIINKYQIKIDYEEVPNNIVIKRILEAEVYSILLNTISNSIKSVIAGKGEKKIKISASRAGNSEQVDHLIPRQSDHLKLTGKLWFDQYRVFG